MMTTLFLSLLFFAPAPLDKPLPPFDPVGMHRLEFGPGHTPWDVIIFPDGFWVSRIGPPGTGVVFLGTWRWEKKGEEIVIEEHAVLYPLGHHDVPGKGALQEYNWVGRIKRAGPTTWWLNYGRVQVRRLTEW